MNTSGSYTNTREAAVGGLAVVGFIALVVAGMWLAVYSARYVPSAVSRIGAAAVYLGSVFTPAPGGSSLSVVPNATTTIPFDSASSTPASSTPSTPATPSTSVTKPGSGSVATTPGTQTSSVTQISGAGTVTYSGVPDLALTLDQIGYLATSSAESFVASSTVPHGSRPAVVFTVKNVGTNVSGTWTFTATIPTATSYVYTSPVQQSLKPGENIVFTLGFDQANTGTNQKVSIHVNAGSGETNMANNDASASLTILGS